MPTVTQLSPTANRNVHYARLYDALDGYRVATPCGTRFVDHDGHVYALDADQAALARKRSCAPGRRQR